MRRWTVSRARTAWTVVSVVAAASLFAATSALAVSPCSKVSTTPLKRAVGRPNWKAQVFRGSDFPAGDVEESGQTKNYCAFEIYTGAKPPRPSPNRGPIEKRIASGTLIEIGTILTTITAEPLPTPPFSHFRRSLPIALPPFGAEYARGALIHEGKVWYDLGTWDTKPSPKSAHQLELSLGEAHKPSAKEMKRVSEAIVPTFLAAP
jgi:hypothetical protein